MVGGSNPLAPTTTTTTIAVPSVLSGCRSSEGSSSAGACTLGWTAMRSYRVLDGLHRLHTSAAEDPRAAAALADIDWRGIEALTETMDLPSPSP